MKLEDQKVICLIGKVLSNIAIKEGEVNPDYKILVDDFIILHSSKSQLKIWKQEINNFLNKQLKLNLHPQKSRIISLSKGINFVGFKNFYYFKLLRKRNIKT